MVATILAINYIECSLAPNIITLYYNIIDSIIYFLFFLNTFSVSVELVTMEVIAWHLLRLSEMKHQMPQSFVRGGVKVCSKHCTYPNNLH